MKKIFILVFLFTFINLGNAQVSNPASDFLKTNYIEGERAFLIKIYQNINYPDRAFQSCRIGKLKARLKISKDGQIIKIGFINHLGEGLEEEIIRLMSVVQDGWTKLERDSIRTLDLTFAFQIGESPIIKGDINVTAEGLFCRSNEYWLSRLKNLISKEKYKKAKTIMEELLRRDPDSTEFKTFEKTINQHLKNKE